MCEHKRVAAYTDDDPDHSWALCEHCESDLTVDWWERNLRDEYALTQTAGNVQHFTRRKP